jgi:hypothetical protein
MMIILGRGLCSLIVDLHAIRQVPAARTGMALQTGAQYLFGLIWTAECFFGIILRINVHEFSIKRKSIRARYIAWEIDLQVKFFYPKIQTDG